MKKLIILLSVAFFALQGKAQDKLVTQDGDVKTVYNVDIGTTKIFYTLENNTNAPIQQVAKKDVLMIKHSDGSKELFTRDTSAPKTETPQNVPATTSTPQTDRHPVVVKNGEFVPVKFINEKEKAKNKKADAFYAVCQLKNGSVLEDDNIKGEYKIIKEDISPFYSLSEYILQITLQNKTDKTLYVDLGNTFIMRGGEATAYYIPSATSTGNGSSAGGSVNLGGVGNALGVGGAAGSLLGAVNVEGGSSKSSSTTTYAQRVIAIPPGSQKALDGKFLFPIGSESSNNAFINNLKSGESLEYNEDNSPVKFSSYSSYSFNEECVRTFPLQANFYVKQIIGCRKSINFWAGLSDLAELLSSDFKDRIYISYGQR